MGWIWWAICAAAATTVVAGDKIRYDDCQLLEIESTPAALNELLTNESNLGIAVQRRLSPTKSEVLSCPSSLPHLTKWVQLRNATYTTTVSNLQTTIDAQLGNLTTPYDILRDDYIEHYHDFEESLKWVHSLPGRFPNLATLIRIGTTYEGREITAVKVSSGGEGVKFGFWMDGVIHAGEWPGTATVTYILYQLLTLYGHNDRITNLINSVDFYILPVFNGDGYSYTWTTDRMWRKTRQPNPSRPECIGTDPNRNWAYHWADGGSSNDPCSNAYHGKSPFDQRCTKAVSDFLQSQRHHIKGYLNIHCCGRMWMTPWGYTGVVPPDYSTQYTAAEATVNAIRNVDGISYRYGTIYDVIYQASGSTVDWTYGELGWVYSYGVEVTTTSTLPESEIVPMGRRVFAGFQTLVEYMLAHE